MFYRDSSRTTGRRPDCKACSAVRDRKSRLRRRDKDLKRQAEWRRLNPDYQSKWYQENKDHHRSLSKKRYEENKDIILERMKKYRSENRDIVNARTRSWKKRNPDKVKEYDINRRGRIRNAEGSYSEEEFQVLVLNHGNRCVKCGIHFSYSKCTRDHIVPLSLGGRNDIGNIQPLCLTCNVRKHNQEQIDYRIEELVQ